MTLKDLTIQMFYSFVESIWKENSDGLIWDEYEEKEAKYFFLDNYEGILEEVAGIPVRQEIVTRALRRKERILSKIIMDNTSIFVQLMQCYPVEEATVRLAAFSALAVMRIIKGIWFQEMYEKFPPKFLVGTIVDFSLN